MPTALESPVWKVVSEADGEAISPFLQLITPHYEVTIECRPSHCNRGTHLAKVWPREGGWISEADFWPRYFFGLDVAIDQVEQWLIKHGQGVQRTSITDVINLRDQLTGRVSL